MMTFTVFETIECVIGEFALPYLINSDPSDLDDEEQTLIDEWFSASTDDWRDSDDNLWVYSHMVVIDHSREEFEYDEITGHYGTTQRVALFFAMCN